MKGVISHLGWLGIMLPQKKQMFLFLCEFHFFSITKKSDISDKKASNMITEKIMQYDGTTWKCLENENGNSVGDQKWENVLVFNILG